MSPDNQIKERWKKPFRYVIARCTRLATFGTVLMENEQVKP